MYLMPYTSLIQMPLHHSAEELLITAIKSQFSLAVDYDHQIALIWPIRYGWKTTNEKGRHKNLFCYQFGGRSSKPLRGKGSAANYRCWNVDMIHSVLPINDAWRPPAGWSTRKSQCIEEVIVGPVRESDVQPSLET